MILNTEPSGEDDSVRAEVVKGDACDPPDVLAVSQFDLVYSNSVIEHVGGHDRRKRFAASARSLAPHHWVQTPYRYFPVEPHFVFPAYQHLPLRTRTLIGRHWGPTRRGVHELDRDAAIDFVQSIELLSITEMKAYFPESELIRERFGGLTKSIIATTASSPTTSASWTDSAQSAVTAEVAALRSAGVIG